MCSRKYENFDQGFERTIEQKKVLTNWNCNYKSNIWYAHTLDKNSHIFYSSIFFNVNMNSRLHYNNIRYNNGIIN